MEVSGVLFAFALTAFAGLATGIGSAIAFFSRRTNTRFLSISLGFSAGVMIYVSMVEIFFKAKNTLVEDLGSVRLGTWATVLSFFLGILAIALIDKLYTVPEHSLIKILCRARRRDVHIAIKLFAYIYQPLCLSTADTQSA